MNFLDIAIIIIISFCLIRGLFKGLIQEVSGIIGVIAGFYGGLTYYPMLIPYIEQWITRPAYQKLVAFSLFFCLIIIGVSLISVLLRNLLQFAFLGWFDRLCGLFFGAMKGVLIVSVLFIVMTNFLPGSSDLVKNSKMSPYVAEVSKIMIDFVSKNLSKDLSTQIERTKKAWKQ